LNYNTYFQSDSLSVLEIVKTLKESLLLLGEMILELPEVDLTREAHEKNFMMITSLTFEQDKMSKEAITVEAFKTRFPKQHSSFVGYLKGMKEPFIKKSFKAAYNFVTNAIIKMKLHLSFKDQELFDCSSIF
jgi:hypothetical protein